MGRRILEEWIIGDIMTLGLNHLGSEDKDYRGPKDLDDRMPGNLDYRGPEDMSHFGLKT